MSKEEAKLLEWFREYQQRTGERLVPIEKFDKEYERLFGTRPLWYSWSSFYRDHGLVGLRPEAAHPSLKVKLKNFQVKNCKECYFGVPEHVGTVKSCCTLPGIPNIDSNVNECLSRVEQLTPRQVKVLTLLRDGFDSKTIANQLDVSYSTVRNHIRQLFEKLHVVNRTDAVVKALRMKIIKLE